MPAGAEGAGGEEKQQAAGEQGYSCPLLKGLQTPAATVAAPRLAGNFKVSCGIMRLINHESLPKRLSRRADCQLAPAPTATPSRVAAAATLILSRRKHFKAQLPKCTAAPDSLQSSRHCRVQPARPRVQQMMCACDKGPANEPTRRRL